MSSPLLQALKMKLLSILVLESGHKGVTTIDPGFKNTGSCKSEITFLDGEKGILDTEAIPLKN